MSHEMSASEAKSAVAKLVETTWKTHFELCLTKATRERGRWMLSGKLSKPSKFAPIPRAVVNVHFRVADESAAIEFQLEEQRTWRPSDAFNDALVQRVVNDKLAVRELHRDIARDAFGSTRMQIDYATEIAEEKQIAKDKETVLYSDESDDEFLADEIVFNGNVPQHVIDPEDVIRNTHIHIREVVEDVFGACAADSSASGYLQVLESLRSVGELLDLDQDDLIILYSLVRESEALTVDLRALLPAVVAKLQARLTHPSRQASRSELEPALIDTHSPCLGRTIRRIVQRVVTHINCHKNMPRQSLRESLANDGEGIFEAEANAVMALQTSANGSVSEIAVDTRELPHQLKRVRLAFAREAFLEFSALHEVEAHIWQLLGGKSAALGQRRGAGESKEGEINESKSGESESKSGPTESDLRVTRAQVYHSLMRDRRGLVLSKEIALAMLASCPSISEAEEVVSGREFAAACAAVTFDTIRPAGLVRNAVLAERAEAAALRIAQGKDRDEFNTGLWHALEAHFPDRAVPVMSSNSFLDCITTYLGESVSPILVDALASVNIFLDAPAEVNCLALARNGYDYVLCLARRLALLEERKKETATDARLSRFQSTQGPMQVVAAERIGSGGDAQLELQLLSSRKNVSAEAKFRIAHLVELFALDDASAFEGEEIDPSFLALLTEHLFLDDKASVVLHVPL